MKTVLKELVYKYAAELNWTREVHDFIPFKPLNGFAEEFSITPKVGETHRFQTYNELQLAQSGKVLLLFNGDTNSFYMRNYGDKDRKAIDANTILSALAEFESKTGTVRLCMDAYKRLEMYFKFDLPKAG